MMKRFLRTLVAVLSARFVSGRDGYHMWMADKLPIASPKVGFFDFDDPGIRDLDNNISMCVWLQFDDPSLVGFPVNLVRTDDTNMFQPFHLLNGYFWSEAINYKIFDEFDASAWHHWCVVYNEGALSVYIDAQLYRERTLPAKNTLRYPGDLTLIFGAHLYKRLNVQNSGNPEFGFEGGMDDFILWSRPITREEIQDVMISPPDTRDYPFSSDIVLYYNFDIVGCDAFAPSLELLKESCPFLGQAKGMKNWGIAGSKYDLLLGRLNNDFGFGTHWGDSEEESECPELHPFIVPQFAKSTVPSLNSTKLTPLAPIVHQKHLDASPLNIPLSIFDAIIVKSLPVGGTLKDASGQQLELNDNVTGQASLVYLPPSSDWDFDMFSVELNGTAGTIQEHHIWALRKPNITVEGNTLYFPVLEATSKKCNINGKASTLTGERFQVIVVELPSAGKLFQVNGGTGGLGSEITQPNTSLNSRHFIYEPDPIPFIENMGSNVEDVGDTIKVAFESKVSSLQSELLSVHFVAIPVDQFPKAIPGVAVLEEESVNGTDITLEASDMEGDVSLVIQELPKKGSLYTKDGYLIERPYDIFHAGDNIMAQYVDEVINVSSFWGGAFFSGYHPMNVIGSPNCAPSPTTPGGVTECQDQRFEDLSSDLIVGDLIMVNLYRGGGKPVYTMGRVWKHHDETSGETAVYDVKPIEVQKKNMSGGLEPCLKVGETYPDSCDIQARKDWQGEFMIYNVTRSELRPIDAGVWCPLNQGYIGDVNIYGGEKAAVYGEEYNFKWNQKLGYSKVQKYTEFIEIKYKKPVFAVNMEVGSPRGGGAIVSIKAKDPNGKWQVLYSGSAQREANAMTNERGFYFIFDETICRPSFKSDTYRLELDTSSETGIGTWNYIDYVKLFGAEELQRAVLRFPEDQVVYKPEPNQFGKDEFKFAAYDCGGSRLRTSGGKTISVQITPTPDFPKATVEPSDKIYVYCTLNNGEVVKPPVPVTLIGRDIDLEEVSARITELPRFGTVKWASGAKQGQDIKMNESFPEGITVYRKTAELTFHPPLCYDRGILMADGSKSFRAQDSVSFNVTDAHGSSVKTVVFDLHCHDLGYDDSVRQLSIALFATNVTVAIITILWVLVMRNHPVVRAAQIPFLVLISVGCIVSSSTLLPLGVNDSDNPFSSYEGKNEYANAACMRSVWLYTLGFVLTFAPLFAKMYRVNRIFASFTIKGTTRQNHLSNTSLIFMILKFALVDILIVFIWQVYDPLVYVRVVNIENEHGNPLKSNGGCTSSSSAAFILAISIYHVLVLLWGSYLCYSTYGITTAFSEAKYVTVSLVSNLQLLVLAIPVILIANETASTSLFARSGVVFLNDLSVLFFIFGPKAKFVFYGTVEHGEGSGFIATAKNSGVGDASKKNLAMPSTVSALVVQTDTPETTLH